MGTSGMRAGLGCSKATSRTLAIALALAVAVSLVAACSGSSTSTARSVVLAPNLTAVLPPDSPKVTAERQPVTGASGLASFLADPEHVAIDGQLPGTAVLAFHVGHVSGQPFLAWLDHGQWVPVPSRYNAATGTVSATVQHFSTWAPLTWATSLIQSWVRGAIQNLFGLGTATAPTCGTSVTVQVTDSNPGHPTIGACAEQAEALPSGNVITRIANLRAYPVDLSYPATIASQCGEYGNCLQLSAQDDLLLKLGAALSPGHNKVLLPGSGTTTAIVDIPAAQSAIFRTSVDSPAMFMAFLEAGVNVFASLVASKAKTAEAAGEALDTLASSQCVSSGWQKFTGPMTVASAESLASAAFGCLSSVLPDILKKLGLRTASLILGAFSVASGFVSAVISSLWGEYDTLFGAHTLTIAGGPAGVPTGPTADNTYLAEGQTVSGVLPHEPSCTPGCTLSGDGTVVLEGTSWSVWSGTEAVGTGTLMLLTCNPDCASGNHYPPVRVGITLSHPVRDCSAQFGSGNTVLGGVRYFWTEVTWTYPNGLPPALQGSNAPLNPWVWSGLASQAAQSCQS